MSEEMKLGPQWRGAELTYRAPTEEGGEDEYELSFSSEEPYERWWGIEVLGHKKSEVDLSWMKTGRAPLLVDHDMRVDSVVGTVSKAWLEDGRGKAIVRFGKNARSQDIKERVKSGDLTNISVGYRIDEMVLEKDNKNGPSTYRATKWTPMECSIVSVPADQTVGIGRSTDDGHSTVVRILTPEPEPPLRRSTMTEVSSQQTLEPKINPDELLKNERTRVSELEKLGAQFNKADLARQAQAKGTSVEEFRGVLLEALGAHDFTERTMNANSLGLSKRDVKQFSFTRLIASAMDPANPNNHELAAFEREICEAEQARSGRSRKQVRGNTFTVPVDILRMPLMNGHRDMTVGVAADGGNLVASELQSASFIDLLRNRMMVQRMGATVLNGLEGNIFIPRRSGGATFYWVGENGDPTESQGTLDQVPLTPKTGGAYTDFSRKLMLQSSLDVEALVRNDLISVSALGVDLAALHGTGAGNQPTGLAATAGINLVALGANGAIPNWGNIVDLETQVAVENADVGNIGYLTNAKVRGKLKTVEKAATTGQFIWTDGAEGMGSLNGYKAGVSNQVASNLVKGASGAVCSGIFYGNWADLLIGMWSGIDILVDPFTHSTKGAVRVVALQDVDVAVRNPESFAYIADALT